jgi:hypothetical protein
MMLIVSECRLGLFLSWRFNKDRSGAATEINHNFEARDLEALERSLVVHSSPNDVSDCDYSPFCRNRKLDRYTNGMSYEM